MIKEIAVLVVLAARCRDSIFALDFARYLVADLACNPWSTTTTTTVDCVGIGSELAAINPVRGRVHDTTRDAHDDPIREHVQAVHTIDQAIDVHLDVTTARVTQAGAKAWPARLLLIDASCAHPTLDELLDLVRTHPGRTGACVLVHGTRGNDAGMLVGLTAQRPAAPTVGRPGPRRLGLHQRRSSRLRRDPRPRRHHRRHPDPRR